MFYFYCPASCPKDEIERYLFNSHLNPRSHHREMRDDHHVRRSEYHDDRLGKGHLLPKYRDHAKLVEQFDNQAVV